MKKIQEQIIEVAVFYNYINIRVTVFFLYMYEKLEDKKGLLKKTDYYQC